MRTSEDYQRDIVAYRLFLRQVAGPCEEGLICCIRPDEVHATPILAGCLPCKARRVLNLDHPGDNLVKGGFFEDRSLF